MIDAYALAREVIAAANERGVSFDEILGERFPPGRGGVGHANARTRRETRRRIAQWLEPREYPEPGWSEGCA